MRLVALVLAMSALAGCGYQREYFPPDPLGANLVFERNRMIYHTSAGDIYYDPDLPLVRGNEID